MASLNLIPNPTVLVVQAGVFLVNLIAVKKLFVEPYMQVRERREKLTVGGKDEANRALAESDETAAKIQARLNAAMAEAKKGRDAVRDAATAKRQQILTGAEAQAKAHVEEIERQIKADLAAERAKVPAIVAGLTDEVYKVALS